MSALRRLAERNVAPARSPGPPQAARARRALQALSTRRQRQRTGQAGKRRPSRRLPLSATGYSIKANQSESRRREDQRQGRRPNGPRTPEWDPSWSSPVHPMPGRRESDRSAEHQKRRRKEHVRPRRFAHESAIEPPSEKQSEQHRDDDHPPENADLPEPGAQRRFWCLAPALLALERLARGAQEAIIEPGPNTIGAHDVASGRRYRTS